MSSSPKSTSPSTSADNTASERGIRDHERGYYLPEELKRDETSKKRKLETRPKPKRLPSCWVHSHAISLNPFSALQHESIFNEIRTMASVDVAHRKLFVRGLSWDTTTPSLQDYFAKFGKIEECTVIMDRNTGKSKGFGFVTYEDMESADRALQAQPHEIDGRKCQCNLAAMPETSSSSSSSSSGKHSKSQHHNHNGGSTTHAPPQPAGPPPQPPIPQGPSPQSYVDGPPGDESERKLFVRGLDYNTHTDTVTAEFKKYGDLDEVTIAKDRQTGKSKGFAFIVFRHQASAKRALAQPQKGRTIHCNLASQKQGANSGGHRPPALPQPHQQPVPHQQHLLPPQPPAVMPHHLQYVQAPYMSYTTAAAPMQYDMYHMMYPPMPPPPPGAVYYPQQQQQPPPPPTSKPTQ
ncbi:hypothetical protein Ae201684P_001662 [Aphanomyces euteiches]|nr:hypothetical protein Ae201684P_001662 [Aphanomyces euteiches]